MNGVLSQTVRQNQGARPVVASAAVEKPGKFEGVDFKKKTEKGQANMVDSHEVEDLCATLSECNLVGNPNEWWIDSGATRHVCATKSMFSTYSEADSEEKLYMGNSSTSKVEGAGKVSLRMTSGKVVSLYNVLHVPEIRKNLVSTSLLVKHGFKVVFVSDKVVISKNDMYVGKGYLQDGLFKLNVMSLIDNKINSSVYLLELNNLWHARLGHVNYKSLKRMINMEILPKFECNKSKCQVCIESKYAKHSFSSVERSSEPLDLIHTDICDMKSTPSRGGKKYFITFIDDSTRYCYVYLLISKDEATSAFKRFKNEVETQLNKKIKMIRSDRGGEYESPFNEMCLEYGIIHQITAPYTPQQNGVAERKNRTLKEMMNALLINSDLPQNLWGEAVLTASRILNRVPYGRTQTIPYEKWKGRKPNLNYFKVWGCLAKVQVPKPKQVKIGPKTIDYVFVGYANNSKAYRFLVYKSGIPDIHVNTIIESANAEFFEQIFPYKKEHGSPKDDQPRVLTKRGDQSRVPTREDTRVDDNPRCSKRQRVSTTFGPDFLTFMLENEPRTFQEAMASSETAFWKEAVNSEIESILSNHTWELVDLPPGNIPLSSKWIFKRKLKDDGTIDKYKARLVVKGYKQREGLDYFDTYSPVSRITSIRVLVALATVYGLQIHQMDVKTAFLNGDLEEEIYMEQPEGFITRGNEEKVCRLVKSLYGLKQAPKQWHAKFDNVMLSNGFKINECDKCVYIKNTLNHEVIVCLYVDDMLIISKDIVDINATKKMLAKRFDMKDLGVADFILGVKIYKTQHGLALSQSHYISKVLGHFEYLNFKEVKTPIDVNLALAKNKGPSESQVDYARVLGCLMYIMNCTRPDIACVVSKLSRFTSNPNYTHWMAMRRVLGYLKHTQDYALHYKTYLAVLEGYSDANWITGSNETKSTSGYVFTIGGGAVSWKSSKQTCIARSTMESEFIALDKAGEEAEWLRNFLEDIPFWPKPMASVCIHCDNQAAIGRAGSVMYNGKSRHIRRRHNTVRQLISSGVISVDYVKSKDNITDPLTKGLPRELVEKTSRGMGLWPRTSCYGGNST